MTVEESSNGIAAITCGDPSIINPDPGGVVVEGEANRKGVPMPCGER